MTGRWANRALKRVVSLTGPRVRIRLPQDILLQQNYHFRRVAIEVFYLVFYLEPERVTLATPPPERGKVLPMRPVRSVTYVSGRSIANLISSPWRQPRPALPPVVRCLRGSRGALRGLTDCHSELDRAFDDHLIESKSRYFEHHPGTWPAGFGCYNERTVRPRA